jgi:hypothetical protein
LHRSGISPPFTRVDAPFRNAPLIYYVLVLQRVSADAPGMPRSEVTDVSQVLTIVVPLVLAHYWQRWGSTSTNSRAAKRGEVLIAKHLFAMEARANACASPCSKA